MTGLELTVGGWFACNIIGKVLDAAHSYLRNNYDLLSGTTDMVTSLENSLPQIQAVIEFASKRAITNRGLMTWLNNLKNASYEAEDMLDDLEAMTIRRRLKGKNKVTEFSSSVKTEELKGLKSAVEKLSKISKGVTAFISLWDSEYKKETEHPDTKTEETSPNLDPNAMIFGRENEINLILDMISNCQLMCLPPEGNSDQEPESQPLKEEEIELPDQSEVKATTRIVRGGEKLSSITRYGEGNPTEVGRKSKDQEIDNSKSSVGEQSLDITRNKERNEFEVEGEGRCQEIGRTTDGEHFFGRSIYEEVKLGEVREEGKSEGLSNMNSSVGKKSVRIRDWKLPVLPIFGMGGVGKTTIAKFVYNDKKIEEGFGDHRAWIYVSENFDVEKIMKEIVVSLGSGNSPDTMINLNIIERELIKIIKDRRLFLVLDDVHDVPKPRQWRALLSALHHSAPGSFVLVTTPNIHVAKAVGNMFKIITLDVLEPKWFKLLFDCYAFGDLFVFNLKSGTSSICCRNNVEKAEYFNLDEEKLRDLKLIAGKIVEKLHRLPLAGEVIGTMLNAQLRSEFWKEILESDWWDHESALEGIIPSLGVGYTYLKPELKQCFAFCSIFPRQHKFDRNILVQMWMAHGYVQPNGNVIKEKLDKGEITMEDVGGKYFDELLERSFFKTAASDGKFVMHDLIRELGIAVSSKEFRYLTKKNYNILPSGVRHLGIDHDDGSKVDGENQNKTLRRTVILFGNWEDSDDESISSIVTESNGLRLLGLSHIRIETNKPFEAICRLVHLRFVDLSFSGINVIPKEFGDIWHLQVLDLRGCTILRTEGMNKLINLRHLYASGETLSKISSIGKLTNLQELEEFRIGRRKGYRISELNNMNQIRGHLLLGGLHNVSDINEAAESQLAKKKYLKSLVLKFEYGQHKPFWLELGLLEALQPPTTVETVTMDGLDGFSLPSWISEIKCVHLRGCKIIQTLHEFGKHRNLEVLSLDGLSMIETVGPEFYGYSNKEVFPRLRELTFSNMLRWRTWSDTAPRRNPFPCLQKIHLENCPNLEDMPTNCFTSAKVELNLLHCPKIKNVATILKGMPFLTSLCITNCCNHLSIDGSVLCELEILCLSGVECVNFYNGLSSLTKIRKLEIKGFDNILDGGYHKEEKAYITSLHLEHKTNSTLRLPTVKLPSLRAFSIKNSPVTEYTEEEETWFHELTSLETLEFSNCCHLRSLPSILPLLSKLKKLTVTSCSMLSSLPEFSPEQKPTELYIRGCSDELLDRCQPQLGEDWRKIFHIPQVRITSNIEEDNYDLPAYVTPRQRHNVVSGPSQSTTQGNAFQSAQQSPPGPQRLSHLPNSDHRTSTITRKSNAILGFQDLKPMIRYDKRMEGRLKALRLYHFTLVGYCELDKHLLTALTERWRPETHTFHFPFGEMTVTLQDVACLWGLPISGYALTGYSDGDWSDLIMQNLGLDPSTGAFNVNTCTRGEMHTSITTRYCIIMSWLRGHFTILSPNASEIDIDRYTRAYVMDLFGSIMFPDSSEDGVPCMYLQFLEDLQHTKEYNWGAAVLSYLYRCLDRACRSGVHSCAGPFLLLQMWYWTRFNKRDRFNDDQFKHWINNNTDLHSCAPLGRYWTQHSEKYRYWTPAEISMNRLYCDDTSMYGDMLDELNDTSMCGDMLDELNDTSIVWKPYNKIFKKLPFLVQLQRHFWLARVPLIHFWIVSWHYPDRVMRQFGLVQLIPPPHAQPWQEHVQLDQVERSSSKQINWADYHKVYVAYWGPNQIDRCFVRSGGVYNPSSWQHYMKWYKTYGMITLYSNHMCQASVNLPHSPPRFQPIESGARITHGSNIMETTQTIVGACKDTMVGIKKAMTQHWKRMKKKLLTSCHGHLEDAHIPHRLNQWQKSTRISTNIDANPNGSLDQGPSPGQFIQDEQAEVLKEGNLSDHNESAEMEHQSQDIVPQYDNFSEANRELLPKSRCMEQSESVSIPSNVDLGAFTEWSGSMAHFDPGGPSGSKE